MTDHHDRFVVKACKPAHNCMVVRKIAITGERGVFGEQRLNVVFAVRALWVACNLTLTPRRKVHIQVIQHFCRFDVERFCLFGHIGFWVAPRHRAQLFGLSLNLG
jgi:hypothetical protein